MSGVSINAVRCVEYLRRIGVDVTDDQASQWQTREALDRAEKRINRAELKRSCGHFRTYWCKVYHTNGLTEVKICSDCGLSIEYRGAGFAEKEATV